jgi:r1t holin
MSKGYLKDLAERVIVTFVGAFLGAVTVTNVADWGNLSMWQSAAAAGGAAVVSLLKGLFASQVGTKGTASLVK